MQQALGGFLNNGFCSMVQVFFPPLTCSPSNPLHEFLSKIYTAYHSMRLSLTKTKDQTLVLTQSLTVVLQQPYRSTTNLHEQLRTWITDADMHAAPCPWAAESTVHIAAGNVDQQTTCKSTDTHAIMGAIQNVHAAPRERQPPTAPVAIEQYALGKGDARGRLVVRVIPGAYRSQAATMHILQALPWVLQPRMHALDVTVVGANTSAWSLGGPLDCGSWVQPAGGQDRPSAVSLCVAITHQIEHVRMVLPFTKGFMHVDQHPPDSERGVDIPSAAATLTVEDREFGVRTYTVCV